jgi:SAM-dependent methyltransferase
VSLHVAWHDVECGTYEADLAVWRALADDPARPPGPVLDVGAGAGRVALDLARYGHEVVALDVDAELLGALRGRAEAEGLAVRVVEGDARGFDLGDARFGLVLAPMQTVQLLEGPDGRAAFLRAAAAHLRPGGLLAAAVAEEIEEFDAGLAGVPAPDIGALDGRRLESRPIAVRGEGDRVALVRLREVVEPDGRRRASQDVVRLDRLDAATLEAEGAAAGLRVLGRRTVPATDDHVGSTVVVLRG